MAEGSYMVTGSVEHPERLVQIEPHGHWRRIPEHEQFSCCDILTCSCSSLTKGSPEKIRNDETTAAPLRHHGVLRRGVRKLLHFQETQNLRQSVWSQAHPANRQIQAALGTCVLGQQVADDGSPEPPVAKTLQAAPQEPAPRTDACQERFEQAAEAAPEQKKAATEKPEAPEQRQEVVVAKLKKPQPPEAAETPAKPEQRHEVAVTTAKTPQDTHASHLPYMTKEQAEAKGFTITWYDPEDTYNPLYFGVSPEDIEEQKALDERTVYLVFRLPKVSRPCFDPAIRR
ncbi:conserved hypothetical protein [Neospora caninum Liverpool]|uniref:Uncharacterized protein n=1 Tax=Neospora caninum (strain Liverpool) TaxID=572307 RepID=F0V7F5_NEOCL|nr:conserved hypothetical protein [Neospora caninum Liverpool]CBZ49646.1 conserved hypothetical protein [Neospora caninum Liverpool]|eukprot:XP_003879681.1 conserved hypothetical protein [Neospora caninum Liverpool]